MKTWVGKLDAVPSKRLFLSIIADYDLNKSICELVDNGFDVWTRSGRQKPIHIKVNLDVMQNAIYVIDNAGGLHKDELRYIVGPGQSGSASIDQTIGIFGVGTKRAVVALAEEIKIRTRFGQEQTFQIEFDEAWLEDEDWELPLYEVSPISVDTTEVALQKLRLKLTDELVKNLYSHLGATYSAFIAKENVKLELNEVLVTPRTFDVWSYPPGYEPRHYSGKLRSPTGTVDVQVFAGLSGEASPTLGEYGVYFYCNERLVAPAMKTFEVGFTTGQAGNPHPKISLTKVIVYLQGSAIDMPWNSSKSDISTKHHIFVALHDWLVKVVADYARMSRTWMGQWPTKVYAHPEGDIVPIEIEDFITARRSFLPDPPKSRPRLADRLEIKNRRLVSRKPWAKELYEGFAAAVAVSKQNLQHANWFSYSLLYLTLQTALKSYIIQEIEHEDDENISLKVLLRPQPKIPLALKELIPLSDEKWDAIQDFSKNHERILYGKTTSVVSDEQLKNIESLVRGVLSTLFKIKLED